MHFSSPAAPTAAFIRKVRKKVLHAELLAEKLCAGEQLTEEQLHLLNKLPEMKVMLENNAELVAELDRAGLGRTSTSPAVVPLASPEVVPAKSAAQTPATAKRFRGTRISLSAGATPVRSSISPASSPQMSSKHPTAAVPGWVRTAGPPRPALDSPEFPTLAEAASPASVLCLPDIASGPLPQPSSVRSSDFSDTAPKKKSGKVSWKKLNVTAKSELQPWKSPTLASRPLADIMREEHSVKQTAGQPREPDGRMSQVTLILQGRPLGL